MDIISLVYIFVGIVFWIGLGFVFGFFPITMFSIIGGAIAGLYLKLSGRI
tara:strand:+ start:365 stop:514 length:150 start_codon:yes stop_codon:yes gene_type:complete